MIGFLSVPRFLAKSAPIQRNLALIQLACGCAVSQLADATQHGDSLLGCLQLD